MAQMITKIFKKKKKEGKKLKKKKKKKEGKKFLKKGKITNTSATKIKCKNHQKLQLANQLIHTKSIMTWLQIHTTNFKTGWSKNEMEDAGAVQ